MNSCGARVLVLRSASFPTPGCQVAPDLQICDGIVVSDDSIVLMEYKSSMFRADTKYGGNHLALTAEIEKKLVQARVIQ